MRTNGSYCQWNTILVDDNGDVKDFYNWLSYHCLL